MQATIMFVYPCCVHKCLRAYAYNCVRMRYDVREFICIGS